MPKQKNNRTRCFISALLLLLLFAAQLAKSQVPGGGGARDRMQGQGRSVLFEPLNFFSDSSGKGRLDILYRIPTDFFIFVSDDQVPANFIAGAEISIEVLTAKGTSIARKIVRRELQRPPDSPSSSPSGIVDDSQRRYVEGVFSFILPVGPYKLVSEVKDRESSRRYFDDKHTVTVYGDSASHAFSDLMLIKSNPDPNDSLTVTPLNFGSDALFGSDFDAYIEYRTSSPPESVHISYAIGRAGSRTGELPGTLRAGLDIVPAGGDSSAYRCIPDPRGGFAGVILPLGGDTLNEGEYTITVRASAAGRTDSIRWTFGVRWFNSPRSLHMAGVVSEVMSYIMSDSEYHRYDDASGDTRDSLFRIFWKRKDPTPRTAYNEALVEYFRRVDHAMQEFSGFNDMFGFKSDRGKAYIIYGPPERTERTLSPVSGPQEIWYYPRIHKKMTFIDPGRKGDYHLDAIDSL